MAGFTVYGQQKLLDHVLGKAAFAMPTVHLALTTTAPTDSAAGAEATYTGYARKATAAADWGAATAAVPSVSSNATTITFNQCTAGSSTVTHFELWDAATGGNRLGWGALNASLAVSAGISPSFAAGQRTASLD